MKIPSEIQALCDHRKALGASQYGDKAYLNDGRDMYQEATEELLDFMNYMEFQSEKEPSKKPFFDAMREAASKLILAARDVKGI